MNHAEDIYLAARERTGADREDYLRSACGADAELRKRVDAMLARSGEAEEFFREPIDPASTTGLRGLIRNELGGLQEGEGSVIGRYKLLQQIGTGGMGVVYMAEQEEPVRRRVALKIIKLGMDTRQVVARFEAERQALAMMDHPNIARVLDAGATESGRPYFVMELVQGVPITEFCDRNKLTVRERIALFLPVCRAIQSAHQKGVIHRDIKPSNVMVTLHHGEPMPKVIDFGVAKATSQRLTEKTVFTQYGSMIGTPAYMSPEQAEMSSLDVDTRTDVYSLGVLLYELLTGSTPLPAERLRSLGFGQIQKVIAEEDPPTPSTRMSTLEGEERKSIAMNRRVSGSLLGGDLRGDLDWIVMRCLEKDRRRRYETPNELAADLQRHLSDDAVLARPPSAAYRFQKAFRRHRAEFIAAGAITLALLLGTGISITQAIRARRAEGLAMDRLKDAESISRFLKQVFQSPDPSRSGYSITVAEALRAAADRVEADLSRMPERRAEMQDTLGDTYQSIGLPREAAALREKVLEHKKTTLGPEHPDTLNAMTALADSYSSANRKKESLALYEQILSIRRRIQGPTAPETITAMENLAYILQENERYAEGIRLQEEVVALRRKTMGPEHPGTLISLQNLSVRYSNAGRIKESVAAQEQVLRLHQRTLGPEDPRTLGSLANLACNYEALGRRDEAIRLQDDLVRLRRKVLGPEHPETLMAMHYRAFYEQNRNPSAAIPLHREVHAIRRRILGPQHPDTILSQHYLALALAASGRPDEAATVREDVVRVRELSNGRDHPHTLDAMLQLVRSHLLAGRFEDSQRLLHECALRVPRDSTMLIHIALHAAWLGPEADYDALVRRISERPPQPDDTASTERMTLLLGLRPTTDPSQRDLLLTLGRRVADAERSHANARSTQLALGLAHLRNERWTEAEAALLPLTTSGALGHPLASAGAFYRALALQQLTRTDEARALYEAAAAAMVPLPADARAPRLSNTQAEEIHAWLAFKEARSVFGDPVPAAPQPR
ncbi:MAG: tetratricopeptide repeat protein [Verrucomicrobiales bacterium]|nr:tetratricopeptide repeat protein [Verrucomicrobiales bacterium]